MNPDNVNSAVKPPYRQKTVQAVIPSEEDLAVITRAAKSCGMNVSSFTRFHVLQAARQIVTDLESSSPSSQMVQAGALPENQDKGA